MSVSLEKALLAGTNLVGAEFYDVIWPKLEERKRYGLFDEVHAGIGGDYSHRDRILPRIEAGYRNIRRALESNHDFSTATDFYVGEMTIRRYRREKGQLRNNFIEDLYRLLSNYGASPSKAFAWLLGLAIIHFVIGQVLICRSPEIICSWDPSFTTLADQAANSLRVITLQRFLGSWASDVPGQALLDSIVAGIAPIQIALLVLAVRARIRR